jgi:hypothetical protein
VAGVGFSGSTLLAFLLGTHPEMVSPGELTGPDPRFAGPEYPCSCGSPLRACAFWNRVAQGMEERGHAFDPYDWDVRFDLGRSRVTRFLLSRSLRSNALDGMRDRLVARLPGMGSRLQELVARNRDLFQALREVSGRQVVADASKHPIRARYLARIPGIDLRVVHLVRDAPGIVASRLKNQGYSVASSIRFWNRGAAHVERLFASLPSDSWLRLRYEDLCRNPREELEKLAGFAGIGPFPRELAWRAGEHHVIGNRMRLSDRVEIALDEAWRELLSAEQVERILRATQGHRARFGYA